MKNRTKNQVTLDYVFQMLENLVRHREKYA
jgi:hypothetical protein